MLAWFDHEPGDAPEKGDALMVAAAAVVAEADAIIGELLAGVGVDRARDFVTARTPEPPRIVGNAVAHTVV